MAANEQAEPERIFQELWRERALERTVEDVGLAQTIRPTKVEVRRPSAVGQLPHVGPETGGGRGGLLEMGGTIGEGGQGIVRRARQLALDRDVAAKTLRREATAPERAAALVREARVTGLLEHPNVVPVYFLAQDAGAPVMAMKHIEGIPWSRYLHGGTPIPAVEEGLSDALEWHLGILMQVANAVEFAHQRGVLHRDLKPDNVMIGGFGEVYLLDWGIAVGLREELRDRLPLARDVVEVAGTPSYMAPEMARGEAALIGPATDVYLLGAVLHEILTGEAPHARGSALDAFTNACRLEPPELGATVPPELAAICRRAMQRMPADRYQTAADVRREVAKFLKLRHSRALATEASAHLGALDGLLGATPAAATHRIYQLFGQCRFGFQQALSIWPDNAQAREGLQRALERMIEFELRREEGAAAAALLADLPEPRPALERRVAELNARAAQRDADFDRLQQHAFETDVRVGGRLRGMVSLILGFTWGLTPAIAFLVMRARGAGPDYRVSFAINLVMLASITGLFLSARRHLLRNQASWRIFLCFLLIALTSMLHVAQAWRLGLDMPASMCHAMLPAVAISGCIAIAIDRRMLPGFLTYLGFYLATFVLPAWSPIVFGLGNLAVCCYGAWVWRHGVAPDAGSPRRDAAPARDA
jgi:serine/threonine-protein kinase